MPIKSTCQSDRFLAGHVQKSIKANISFPKGVEVEAIMRLPELAETIKEKIKQ